MLSDVGGHLTMLFSYRGYRTQDAVNKLRNHSTKRAKWHITIIRYT